MAAVLLEVRAYRAFTYPDTAVTSLVQVGHWRVAWGSRSVLLDFRSENQEMHQQRAISPDFR
jgi:hypothetical protein